MPIDRERFLQAEMLRQQCKFLPDRPLETSHGEVVLGYGASWDALGPRGQQLWIEHAKRALLACIVLFGPRYVFLNYATPFGANLRVSHDDSNAVMDCGTVNVIFLAGETL